VAELVYLLCAATSAGCAALLLRQYGRVRRQRRGGLLLWSSLCFSGLAAANLVLVVDLVVLPAVDMSLLRAALGAAAIVVLVVGLIWELE
jgi:uncharacterized protein DUF5985